MFGGATANGVYSDETWQYDISDNEWSLQVTANKPSADYDYRMGHLGAGRVLYHNYNETWVYTSGGWTNMNPANAPPNTYGNDIAYLGEDKALMFGGSYGWPPAYNDAWIYDYTENTWSIDPNTTKPSARNNCGLAESSMDGTSEIVLFSGTTASQVFPDDTWLFGDIEDYTMTYNGNGNTDGTAPVDPASPYEAGSMVTVLDKGDLVRSGYTFNNWNTAANGSGTSYAPGAAFNMPESNIILYAQWARVSPQPIPTLSEWGMIIFSLLLAGSAIWMMRRRQAS